MFTPITAYDCWYPQNTSLDYHPPQLTATDHYWPLLTTTDHYWPLLTTTDHYWPLLTTTDHYWPSIPPSPISSPFRSREYMNLPIRGMNTCLVARSFATASLSCVWPLAAIAETRGPNRLIGAAIIGRRRRRAG